MAHHRWKAQRGQARGWTIGIIVLLLIGALVVLEVRDAQRFASLERQSEQQISELQQSLKGNQALLRLNALRTELRAGVDPQAMLDRYEAIRTELQEAYAGEALDRVRDQLEELRQQLATGSDAAAETIDAIVSELGRLSLTP